MSTSSPEGPCHGGCDCGAVRFELDVAPTVVNECDCSFCRKLGMLWAYFPPTSFRLVAGTDASASYTRGDKVIAFRFCPRCGCMVSWEALPDRDIFADGSPPKVGVNARLIEGLDARKLPRMA